MEWTENLSDGIIIIDDPWDSSVVVAQNWGRVRLGDVKPVIILSRVYDAAASDG